MATSRGEIAPPVVLEAPEGVGLLLHSCRQVGDSAGARSIIAALDAAATEAAGALHRHLPVTGTTVHEAHIDAPDTPRPHVHLTLRARALRRDVEGWGSYSHAVYQGRLQTGLTAIGIQITEGAGPCGWEITSAMPHLGTIRRRRCGRGLYPLDLDLVRNATRSA